MSERKTYTIRMLPDVMKRLKILSAEREVKISDLIEEAVQDMLKKAGSETRKTSKK